MILEKDYPWNDYELIDSGFEEKLERFGKYILIRPEPQALWPKQLSDSEWLSKAHGRFVRDNSKKSHRDSLNENGGWTFFKPVPNSWELEYKPLGLKLKVSCTSFGHLGVFVEQVSNWHFIDQEIKRIGHKPKVLNLFAYTGAASIVAANAGANPQPQPAGSQDNCHGKLVLLQLNRLPETFKQSQVSPPVVFQLSGPAHSAQAHSVATPSHPAAHPGMAPVQGPPPAPRGHAF